MQKLFNYLLALGIHEMKLWKFLAGAVAVVVVAITTINFLDRDFLPRMVLNIAELPEAVEVIDFGDNSVIGNQLFVNHWLLRLKAGTLPWLLAGNFYSPCSTGSTQAIKLSALLNSHKSFDYTQCFQYSAEHHATFIYLNTSQEMALVEYQSD